MSELNLDNLRDKFGLPPTATHDEIARAVVAEALKDDVIGPETPAYATKRVAERAVVAALTGLESPTDNLGNNTGNGNGNWGSAVGLIDPEGAPELLAAREGADSTNGAGETA